MKYFFTENFASAIAEIESTEHFLLHCDRFFNEGRT